MSVINGQCPLCDWSARQSTGKQDEELIKSYVAKALMNHLRLKHARHDETRTDNIGFSTILSNRTKMGMIEFSLNEEMSQWDLDKAREIHKMLGEAIEAAVSDTLIFQFLVKRIGLDEDRATAALFDFRELRQGSRDKVQPS
jgi:hypothetical protein